MSVQGSLFGEEPKLREGGARGGESFLSKVSLVREEGISERTATVYKGQG